VQGGGACPAGAKRMRGRIFCHPGTSFDRSYACRDTKLISGTDLSECNKCYKMGTGAVSRYKFDRSQESITVQDLDCGQVHESGCNGHYKFVLGAVSCKNHDEPINYPVRVRCS
jgi:hypothetical protein